MQISSATSNTFSLITFFSTPVEEVRRWNRERLPFIKIDTAEEGEGGGGREVSLIERCNEMIKEI